MRIQFMIAALVLTVVSCTDEDRIVSALKDGEQLPEGSQVSFLLHQNFPNPFNPSTTIRFDLSVSTHVRLWVSTEDWVKVATLVDENLAPGAYQTTFSAGELPSGEYLCIMEVESVTQIRKMTLVK